MKEAHSALPVYHSRAEARQYFCGLSLKYLSLIILVLQNSTLVIMMRYSRTFTTAPGQPLYLASTAVFFAECIKLIASLGMVYYEKKHWQRFVRLVRREILGRPSDILRLIVPSGLYALQNNLLYVALSNLEAATYQVTYQLKILSTAMFSVAMLGRSLNSTKWTALLLLMVGVALAQLQLTRLAPPPPPPQPAVNVRESPPPASGLDENVVAVTDSSVVDDETTIPAEKKSIKLDDTVDQNPIIGFMAVFASCISSGFAGCYLERILKSSDSSMWIRNVQLGISGTLFSLLAIIVNDQQRIREGGLLQGYNWLTYLVILNQALSGLVVAVVVKYADNILKGFATSISIIISSILSCFLFDFQPSIFFMVGSLLVISSTVLYSRPDPKPLKASTA